MSNIITQSLTIEEIENMLNNKNDLTESQLNSFRIMLDDRKSLNIQVVKIKGKYHLLNGYHRAVLLTNQFTDKMATVDCDVLIIS